MGIYTNGIVYGIRIIKFIDDETHILFERKENEQIRHEAKVFYETLVDKNNLSFSTLIECSSTYGEGVYKSWSIISLDTFLEFIGI